MVSLSTKSEVIQPVYFNLTTTSPHLTPYSITLFSVISIIHNSAPLSLSSSDLIALDGNVAGLLAVVAHSALGLAALLGHVAHGAAVVALLAHGAVLGQVALAATRVARLGSAKLGGSSSTGSTA